MNSNTTNQSPPEHIEFHQKSQRLDVSFQNQTFTLSAEYLRVFSPSAEVRGHGGGPIKLVTGKKNVQIVQIEPVGHYAIKLTFNDGHDSGLYTWSMLWELGDQQTNYWPHYLQRLKDEGGMREPPSVTDNYTKVN